MTELKSTITERRRLTRNSIYLYLYDSAEERTKQEIATDLGLSMPTVHQNISELIDAGLIERGSVKQSTGGRRAIGLRVCHDQKYAIGMCINEKDIRYMALDLKLHEVAYRKETIVDHSGSHDITSVMYDGLTRFVEDNHLDKDKLLGIGIALPGLLDDQRKEIILSPTMSIKHLSLKKLSEMIPYPTFMENDATCGGYAECFMNHSIGNMAYLMIEIGVGGCIMIQSTPYYGTNFRGAEFGHICVEPGGLKCNCGKSGCLEAYISAARISDDLGISVEGFFAELERGNHEYAILWDDVLRHLAIGINDIRMVLDCEVVLGGFMTQYIEPYMPKLKKIVADLNPYEIDGEYVKLCKYPKRDVVIGAALHYVDEYIKSI